jgi:4-amino-4-deoxy-L-arabinose transferase-like glycosyltransferase
MTRLFWTLVGVLVLSRFYAFRAELDHPHLFRQADTAFYSLGFHRFGMDLFLPSVGWMGSYRHVLLEFPLTEWIAASIYALTGPTILVDRLVNFAFFLSSAGFLFLIARRLADATMGRIVAVVYMAAPLGIYYSRAVHIDFTAVCFAHGLVFLCLRYLDTGGRRHLVVASLAGTLAFVIKAPYAFFLAAPVVVYAVRDPTRRGRLGPVLGVFAWSALTFAAWHTYSEAINRRAPDLSFIPSYERHVDRYRWYFGTFADRARFDYWYTVLGRVYREIATTFWWIVVPFGVLVRERYRAYFVFALAWSAGAVVYLLVFFTLNEAHNYYQIPFIAPFSLWLAAPIHACWTATGERARLARATACAVLAAYVASSLVVASRRFYRPEPFGVAAGRFIEASTSPDDLIVMAPRSDSRHGVPTYLFLARRYGWSVGPDELSPEVVEGLRPHGATLVVSSTASPPPAPTLAYLARQELVGSRIVAGFAVNIHRIAPPRKWQ